jgi:hypothetical protein
VDSRYSAARAAASNASSAAPDVSRTRAWCASRSSPTFLRPALFGVVAVLLYLLDLGQVRGRALAEVVNPGARRGHVDDQVVAHGSLRSLVGVSVEITRHSCSARLCSARSSRERAHGRPAD